jgi:hypothetical protein
MGAIDFLKLTLVFVVIAGSIVGGAAVLESGRGPGGTSIQSMNASTFDPGAIVASEPEPTGNASVDVDEEKVVLVDAAHSNQYSRDDIEPLVRTLVADGHEIRFFEPPRQRPPGATLNGTLAGADALVVVAPSQRYTADEVRSVSDFARRGGRVLVLVEPTSTQVSSGGGGLFGLSSEQVTTEITPLSSAFDIAVGTGYLFTMHENDNNFRNVFAEPTNSDNLTEGVDRMTVQQATPLTAGENATVLARTTERTQLSSTRDGGRYPVILRNGNVTAVGDASLVTPATANRADNEVLLGNLAEYLVTGNKTARPESDATNTTGGGFGPGPGPGPGPESP